MNTRPSHTRQSVFGDAAVVPGWLPPRGSIHSASFVLISAFTSAPWHWHASGIGTRARLTVARLSSLS